MLSPDQVKALKKEDYQKYCLVIDWEGGMDDSCTRIYMHVANPAELADAIGTAFKERSDLWLTDVVGNSFTASEIFVRTAKATCYVFYQVDGDDN